MLNNEFESFLAHSLDDCPDGMVKEAAYYSLLAGGKRVRPRLLDSVLKAYRIDSKKGLACACAIEMMHTYSLIHDDLPSMDNDTLRRGKPTCHVKYGEAVAILAGDALLTHSFSLASNASQDKMQSLHIVKELVLSGGLSGMIYGQELDIDNGAKKEIETTQELERIHRYKTGQLIALPMVCASILAGRTEDSDTWREIGYLVGVLFQIQDDLFDVTKSTEELGKNSNSDASNNKVTYVTLLDAQGCTQAISQIHNSILEKLDVLNIDKEPIIEMLEYLIHRNN